MFGKLVLSAMVAIMLTAIVAAPAVSSDNWPCEVLLCLSNPGGPKEFAECHPPIDRLYEHLFHGGSFPVCGMVSVDFGDVGAADIRVKQGYQPYFPCEETYGPDYTPYDPPPETSSGSPDVITGNFDLSSINVDIANVAIDSKAISEKQVREYTYTGETVCRKYMGEETKMVCDGNGELTNCAMKTVPVYDTRTPRMNLEPRYVQVVNSGVEGQRFYYKVQKKSSGPF